MTWRIGVTLADLRTEVQIEAHYSTGTSHDLQFAARINHKLNQAERHFASKHTWPTLNFEEEVTVDADSATGALPADIGFTEISSVFVLFGSDWLPITHGIGARERTIYNADARATPIRRWEIITPGDEEYEVWPIGGVDQTLRFTGSKAVGLMADDEDTCLIDADVLVLYVAGQLLASKDPDDAALKLKMADDRVQDLLYRQVGQKTPDVSLIQRPQRILRPGIDYIPRSG